MRVLIAADKFKGSLTAVQVAERLTAGLRRALPTAVIESVPVADGGDGTVDAAIAAGFERREVTVTGPLGHPVTAVYAVREDTAVIEMAAASGLRHLPQGVFAPLTATTYGTGEVLQAALDNGVRRIVLGVGGSATTDGGAGMLTAVGARFLDAAGRPIGNGGAALARLATADLTRLDPRLRGIEVVLASDVDNPLLGPKGAAAVYGPQKGASAKDVAELDAALRHYAETLDALDTAEAPGAGAAGGLGFGALVGLSASFRPGVQVLLEMLGFNNALSRADLVITGEGSLDSQTLHGKAPAGVASAARERDLPVIAVCGRLALPPDALETAGIQRAYALTDIEPDVNTCITRAGPLLERLAERMAADI